MGAVIKGDYGDGEKSKRCLEANYTDGTLLIRVYGPLLCGSPPEQSSVGRGFFGFRHCI